MEDQLAETFPIWPANFEQLMKNTEGKITDEDCKRMYNAINIFYLVLNFDYRMIAEKVLISNNCLSFYIV